MSVYVISIAMEIHTASSTSTKGRPGEDRHFVGKTKEVAQSLSHDNSDDRP